jgi:PAT family beta-lactamase induction signal transducer AmpG
VRGGLRYKLSIVAIVYVIEGYPMGVFADLLPVFLRRHDVSRTAIGLLSGLALAWSLKVLWSPLIDRYGERRQWIAGALVVMAACLAALVVQDPRQLGIAFWLAVASYCLASATQDIAIDAYTIGFIDRGQEGPANAMRFAAYRGGLLLSGGALLLLPRWIGWDGTLGVAAALSLAMAASLVFCPKVAVPPESQRDTWGALKRWAGRSGALWVALFVMLYRVGDRAMGPMVKPFWVDRGFSDEEIAVFSSTFGVIAMVLGAVAGGAVVSRVGIGRSLWWLGVPALASNLAYAAAAALPEIGRGGVYGASIVESFCGGMASAAFMSYLMRICQKEHAAVQYALLTALYAVVGTLVAVPSGWLTERIEYAAYFSLTAAYALPAFVFLAGARHWLDGRDR